MKKRLPVVAHLSTRNLLRRWNAHGPDGLADRRRANKSPGKLSVSQQSEAFEALKAEPPDGGLWSGPKLTRYVRGRWGIEV